MLRKQSASGDGLLPAAQYIRMSTEHQRFSPDNQHAANSAWALLHGFEIVETYQDSGKSGLTLRGRPALKQLLSDVLAGDARFKAILVLDVSRWGRFQDTDQAAHYEYMCREAGVPIHYCVEPFGSDGGAMASIVKHMKRVMAAEYSRDLSAKVSRAQRQQARMGFKQGGMPPFGTRRQVVDEHGAPRMVLGPGERKGYVSDRVVLTWGPPDEVALVRQVFRLFVRKEMWLSEIAVWLNQRGHRQAYGALWKGAAVRFLLSNEIYLGKYRFGRKYSNLGQPYLAPTEESVSIDIFKPMIGSDLFAAAADRLEVRAARPYTDETLLEGLRRLLKEKGTISSYLIQNSSYLPYPDAYIRHFGSLGAAYSLIGYTAPDHNDRCELRYRWTEGELLDALRRIHRERGVVTQRAIADDFSSPTLSTFSNRFGGLINAMLLAGIPMRPLTQRQEAALVRQRAHHGRRTGVRKEPVQRTARGDRISNDELDTALAGLLARHGFIAQVLIDADPTIPSSSFFRNRLGGLKGAYARVGYHATQSKILKEAYKRSRLRLSASLASV